MKTDHATKKKIGAKNRRRNRYIGIALLAVVAVAAIGILSGLKQDAPATEPEGPAYTGAQPSSAAGSADAENLVIQKSGITETADFIAYRAGGIDMEVIAVKASDGTIRAALNTCQVCYDSGKGYYVQEGDELVCQNCGNRFSIDEIGDAKSGCNPVPVAVQYLSEDDQTITISGEFLSGNANLFAEWEK
ncbi:MAG: DUF2318 domain-containing protein [Bacillota bacterium]